MLRVLDLFSGIGGFSLGLERAGMRTTAFCEIDPFCRKVLAKHWPDVPIHDDIRKLDGTQYAGTVDLVCGGYPCQPFSVAGNQRGEDDHRHLWPEMLRIIQQCRPRWVVSENVTGHVNLGFDTVASQLEGEGFAVWPFLIPASAVGGHHSRERLWIVGYSEHNGSPPTAVAGVASQAAQRHTEGADETRESSRASESTDCFDLGNRGGSSDPAAHWLSEPELGRMADGLPSELDKSRIIALGNAVVPQIPELIGRGIIAYEQQLAIAA